MARKKKRKESKQKDAARAAVSNPARVAEHVRQLLESGGHKAALSEAKALHKAQDSEESQALLEEAYLARIRGMRDAGMIEEAQALISVAKEKYPNLAGRLQADSAAIQARSGDWASILAPLGNGSASREQRAAVENIVRAEAGDPSEIADCTALPADHPLRRGAAAVARALEAVTTRPVEDSELALPEVSRRSPFAPWKPMLRAIAAFYRRGDDRAQEFLHAVPSDSAAARGAPVLRAMMGEREFPMSPTGAPHKLVIRVSGGAGFWKSAIARSPRRSRVGRQVPLPGRCEFASGLDHNW